MADENTGASGASTTPTSGGGSTSTGSGTSAPASSGASPSAAASLERVSAALGGDGSSPSPTGTAGPGALPASPTSPATTGAAAAGTGQPVRGPIPYDRHEAILHNAREEAKAEALKAYEWVTQAGLPLEEAQRRFAIAQRLFENPQAFHQQLGSELNPEPADDWQDPQDPEPDLLDMQGRPAGYSPKTLKVLLQNEMARLRRELQQQYGPLQESVGSILSEREMLQLQTQATKTASEVIGELERNPAFKENKAKVLAVYQGLVQSGYMERHGAVATLHAAWNKFYHEQIVPTLGQKTQQQVLSEMRQSAHAGSPGALPGTPPAPPKPKLREGNLDDLAAHMAALSGAQSAT